MDETAIKAHAAWKAAFKAARDIRERTPVPYMTDENRATWIEDSDRIKAGWYDADRVTSEAFRAMAHALPEAGPINFTSPREWLADQDNWRTEFAAVKVWNKAEFYNNWYPCLAHYEVNLRTGERFLRAAEMFDDCVDEAERRNAKYAAYYAEKYPEKAA